MLKAKTELKHYWQLLAIRFKKIEVLSVFVLYNCRVKKCCGGYMGYPKIYLAIDNCFASKRWTEPFEWMSAIKGLGLSYVEASADNECDPLYMGSEYLQDWSRKVKQASLETGVKVVNLYSGHGTYSTLGLAHTDVRIRDRFLHKWLRSMAETAGGLSAGMGFFCHAFSESVLQDAEYYKEMEDELYTRLAKFSDIAGELGCRPVGVEQMYTPHQIPWTIQGAVKLLQTVNRRSKYPFYITIDVGHQSGQRKFIRPASTQIKSIIAKYREGYLPDNTWLGPGAVYDLLEKAAKATSSSEDALAFEIEKLMDKYPYLYACYEDGDTYLWLEQLGCYSPIIHLQQTSGKSSSHWPFTKEFNEKGIIIGSKVLKSIRYSYENLRDAGEMPEKCRDIYLTLEMFSGTADLNCDILRRVRETVEYWRSYIPEDGLELDKIT